MEAGDLLAGVGQAPSSSPMLPELSLPELLSLQEGRMASLLVLAQPCLSLWEAQGANVVAAAAHCWGSSRGLGLSIFMCLGCGQGP